MNDGAWDEMVTAGRAARAHGNRGAVIVNPETDFPDTRFGAGVQLFNPCPPCSVQRMGSIPGLYTATDA